MESRVSQDSYSDDMLNEQCVQAIEFLHDIDRRIIQKNPGMARAKDRAWIASVDASQQKEILQDKLLVAHYKSCIHAINTGQPLPPQLRSGEGQVKIYSGVLSGHWIKKNVDSGEFIILEDNSLWKIDPQEKIDAMLWLPVSRITIVESNKGSIGHEFLLINIDEGEKAHAKYMGK